MHNHREEYMDNEKQSDEHKETVAVIANILVKLHEFLSVPHGQYTQKAADNLAEEIVYIIEGTK